jgi:hypothetical protein
MQGYLWAKEGPGNYTLVTSGLIDDVFYAWHGAKAYSDYQKDNYDYLANSYNAQNGYIVSRAQNFGRATVQVGVGELVPVTFIWANGGGPGQAYLNIIDPAGNTHMDTSGFFVPANSSCPGYVDPFSP